MKRLFIFLCCLLSLTACSSCAGTIGNSPWRSTDDPNALYARELMQQTVRIKKEIDIELREDMFNDKSLAEPVKDTLRWAGSGVVVDYKQNMDKGESLIMTAGHICETPKKVEYMGIRFNKETKELEIVAGMADVVAERYTVDTLDGRHLESRVIYYTMPDETDIVEKPDICAVASLGKAGNVAELADDMPPEGAIVTNVGYPLGIHQTWMAHIADGRYEGLTDGLYNEAALSIPSVGGLSGSPIYYRGKVFAILVKGARRFEHFTLGTALPYVKDAMKKAEVKWRSP